MKQTQIGTMTKLEPSEGGLIHKIGTDVYAPNSIMLLPGESVDMYEEVAARPAYSKAEYDAKVAELVRERYTASDEFAIQRKAINTMTSGPTLALPEGEGVSPSLQSGHNGQSGHGGVDALEEYAEYNAYVEECKQRAKEPALYAATNYEVGTINEGECDG